MENKIKIGIVEDEIFIAENLKYTLEDLGYEVAFVCHNYQNALNAVQTIPFDLVLLDIHLRGSTETGLDIAEFLVTQKNSVFIFVTAYSDKDTIKKAVKYKPSAYLVKPINEGSLFAAIQTAIENFDMKTEATLPNEESQDIGYFFTKIGNKIIKIQWTDVYSLVATKNYVSIITIPDNREYPIRSSLQQAMNKIVPPHLRERYIQVNRATFLDKSIIQGIDSKNVLTTQGEYEIGSSFLADIKKYLNIL